MQKLSKLKLIPDLVCYNRLYFYDELVRATSDTLEMSVFVGLDGVLGQETCQSTLIELPTFTLRMDISLSLCNYVKYNLYSMKWKKTFSGLVIYI